MKITLSHLRNHAVASSLFSPTTLGRAMNRLGFVQADPIRAPARAQDLILRHRVKGYQAGDLERRYHRLDLQEDFLYAYGFMPMETWRLLHPREQRELTITEQQVLQLVSAHKRLHPADLEAHLGNDRELNAWGGYSKSTTRALEKLHHLGLIRIAGRNKGVRLYQRVRAVHEPLCPVDRLRRLTVLITTILAPIPKQSLLFTLQHLRSAALSARARQDAIEALLQTGELQSMDVAGIQYLKPAGRLVRKEPDEAVRFLAPFDPLVWDRRRFELFWGWAYRFEAYTPLPKRKLGYYALPLLWESEVIGWVNASVRNGELTVNPGFVTGKAPTEKAFRKGYELEMERFRHFLGLSESTGED